MALEERQKKIVEGAGREEARLNTEFIDLLRKWYPLVLGLIAVTAGGVAAWTHYKRHNAAKQDAAWAEFDAAMVAGKPENLVAVANDFSDRTPAITAKLTAADIRLDAFRTALPPGIRMDPMGNLPEGATLLTEDQRKAELDQAEALYREALRQADGSSTGVRLLAINARMGLAAVAESRGQLDGAREQYTKVGEDAKAIGFSGLERLAKARLDSLSKLEKSPRLYAEGELHASVKPVEAPMTTPMTNIQARDAQGNPIELPGQGPQGGTMMRMEMRDGKLVPVGDVPPGVIPLPPGTMPQNAPTPAPAPAPTPSEPAPATPPAQPAPTEPGKP